MQVIAEAAVGRPTLGNAAWISITAIIVVAAYAVAIAVPNIWPVMVRSLPRPLCTNESVAVVGTASARASAAPGMDVPFSVSKTSFWQCLLVQCLGALQTITGATAAVAIGWIFPACIMLRRSGGRCSWLKRLGACLLILLGLLTAVVAVHSTIEDLIH